MTARPEHAPPTRIAKGRARKHPLERPATVPSRRGRHRARERAPSRRAAPTVRDCTIHINLSVVGVDFVFRVVVCRRSSLADVRLSPPSRSRALGTARELSAAYCHLGLGAFFFFFLGVRYAIARETIDIFFGGTFSAAGRVVVVDFAADRNADRHADAADDAELRAGGTFAADTD